jgi:mRNA interferase RelE/StbE
MFKLEFSSKSAKFLKKGQKDMSLRIFERIQKLSENPFPSDCKRVEGRKEKVFRVRVGNYRILYVVFHEDNKLFISEIDKRNRIYD